MLETAVQEAIKRISNDEDYRNSLGTDTEKLKKDYNLTEEQLQALVGPISIHTGVRPTALCCCCLSPGKS